jgi:hypothetical protein
MTHDHVWNSALSKLEPDPDRRYRAPRSYQLYFTAGWYDELTAAGIALVRPPSILRRRRTTIRRCEYAISREATTIKQDSSNEPILYLNEPQ